MVIDNLLKGETQTRLDRILDHLLSDKLVAKSARNYIISCKVEGKSKRTIETYSMVLSRFARHYDPETATTNDIRMFLLSLQETLCPGTLHIYYRTLKTFFNWMVNENLIPKNPMANIRRPKLPKVLIQPFNSHDIEKLMTLCQGNRFLDIRNRVLFLIFLDTGVRLEEMSRIMLDDLDLDNQTIRIMGKGNKGRLVRMGKVTEKALLKYLLTRKDDHPNLWVTEERRPMTVDGICTTVRRYCKVAVTSGARPSAHTFRHTAAINYLRNGGDQFTLQIMLGHASLEMTRRYVSSLGVEDMLRVHSRVSPVDHLIK